LWNSALSDESPDIPKKKRRLNENSTEVPEHQETEATDREVTQHDIWVPHDLIPLYDHHIFYLISLMGSSLRPTPLLCKPLTAYLTRVDLIYSGSFYRDEKTAL